MEKQSAPYISETKRIGDKVVRKYSVGATDLIVYEAWEPSARSRRLEPVNHSTITTIEGQWYGRIGTRYLPPEIEALPRGDERYRAVGKWHEDQYEESYRLIIQAFPEAGAGKRSMGEITLHWTSPGAGRPKLTRDDVRVEVWEERDRLHIGIQDKETGEYVVSWWDDEAREMFEQGFFKRGRELRESVLRYAEEMGMLATESTPGRPHKPSPWS